MVWQCLPITFPVIIYVLLSLKLQVIFLFFLLSFFVVVIT